MRTKENKKDRTLDYIMGRIVPAYVGFIIAIFMTLVLFGCHSQPSDIEGLELKRSLHEDTIPCRDGYIVKIENVTYDYRIVLVQEQNADKFWTALAQMQENFKIGDRVETCEYEILEHPHIRGYGPISIVKKDVQSFYDPSELEKYEQCRKELEQCNDDLVGVYDTCTKHLQETK